MEATHAADKPHVFLEGADPVYCGVCGLRAATPAHFGTLGKESRPVPGGLPPNPKPAHPPADELSHSKKWLIEKEQLEELGPEYFKTLEARARNELLDQDRERGFTDADVQARAAELEKLGEAPGPCLTPTRLVSGASTRGILGARRRKRMDVTRERKSTPIDASTFDEIHHPFFPLAVEDTKDPRDTVRMVVDGATWGEGNLPTLLYLRLSFSTRQPDQTFTYELLRPSWWRRLLSKK